MISLMNFEYMHRHFTFCPQKPLDISLVLKHGENNVNCYYAEPVHFTSIRQGDFIGSVAEGGPCNHQKISLSPHGNGTHTECYGHISGDPKATLFECLKEYLFFAQLISLPTRRVDKNETILLEDLIPRLDPDFLVEALIIRTLPNDPEKRTRQYSGSNPPFLEPELGRYLAQQGIKHLLVDLPSVDPEQDDGLLQTHHDFWQYPDHIRYDATISELIFVDDAISDGFYLLNLQVISIDSDASPSKPMLYALDEIAEIL